MMNNGVKSTKEVISELLKIRKELMASKHLKSHKTKRKAKYGGKT